MKIGEAYNSLTQIRKAIYDYVRNAEEQSQTNVTLRDIMAHVGISSTSAADHHVRILCDIGLLYKDRRGHIFVTGSWTTMPHFDVEIDGLKPDTIRSRFRYRE